MNFNLDYENIATAFVQHYYSKFDQGDGMARAQGLGGLYDPENSYMTFEGTQCKGRDAILAKFTSLTFKQIQRAITKCDSQPLYDGSILVMVLGQLKTDDDPINTFSQVFILRPNTTGSFFIGNEVFRLDLHNN
uniref:NTF2-related export protein n=1 Tax=Angiostrongylus cantonensis TaxID=6313 RepID=A0A0K0DBC0_ANGCA